MFSSGQQQAEMRTPALGQLKKYTGFLVSRSLTLPAAQLDEPQALLDEFTST